ncbi:hypothetical protein BGZ54_005078, partial [Gamsiella multidivaricata]
MQRLWNAVEANKGSFSEETGKIEISLGSSTLELKILLGWDMMLEDLRNLDDAVTKTSVLHLWVNGSYGPSGMRLSLQRASTVSE